MATWEGVRALRLARGYLDQRAPRGDLVRVVSEVPGLHAQVASAAELQAWARVEDVRPDDVRDALWERRSLVRTWLTSRPRSSAPCSRRSGRRSGRDRSRESGWPAGCGSGWASASRIAFGRTGASC